MATSTTPVSAFAGLRTFVQVVPPSVVL